MRLAFSANVPFVTRRGDDMCTLFFHHNLTTTRGNRGFFVQGAQQLSWFFPTFQHHWSTPFLASLESHALEPASVHTFAVQCKREAVQFLSLVSFWPSPFGQALWTSLYGKALWTSIFGQAFLDKPFGQAFLDKPCGTSLFSACKFLLMH